MVRTFAEYLQTFAVEARTVLGQDALTHEDVKGWGSTPTLAAPQEGERLVYLPQAGIWIAVAATWVK